MMGTGKLLDGKVAFVTGGAQGIGLAVSRAFADQGASVMLADIAADKVEEKRDRAWLYRHALDVAYSSVSG